jgi:hypothetical protein
MLRLLMPEAKVENSLKSKLEAWSLTQGQMDAWRNMVTGGSRLQYISKFMSLRNEPCALPTTSMSESTDMRSPTTPLADYLV